MIQIRGKLSNSCILDVAIQNFDFVDDDLKDSITGGSGHLVDIKVYNYEDKLSVVQWSVFCTCGSL